MLPGQRTAPRPFEVFVEPTELFILKDREMKGDERRNTPTTKIPDASASAAPDVPRATLTGPRAP